MGNKVLKDIIICGIEMLVERPSPQEGRMNTAFIVLQYQQAV